MSKATVVIGSSFGDEAKGLMTDFLVRKNKISAVVRFNGGAQAGHTVQTKDARHVFGHLSAGSFANADTYLSSDFIVNPTAFQQELQKFSKLHVNPPMVFVNKNCIVSTIYDMILNSLVELKRGSNAHGSCGMGINETVTRSAHKDYLITANDLQLFNLPNLTKTIQLIKSEWLPRRWNELELDEVVQKFTDNKFSKTESKMLSTFFNILSEVDPKKIAEKLIEDSFIFGRTVLRKNEYVFEGAQGLMLDEELGEFPHVTRSLTGLPNAIRAAHELDVSELQPLYIMRAYTTRHGNGPLAYTRSMDLPADKTNQPNMWQGSLRFGLLNLPKIKEFIQKDLDRSLSMAKSRDIKINTPELAISCLDQADSFEVVAIDGGIKKVKSTAMKDFVQTELGYNVRYTSHGPTAETVVQY